jgi:hypothetical protein
MADRPNLKEALAARGPYAVWDLMSEDEQRAAATALWTNADRDTRTLLEMTLAKDLKFRPQSVRRLPAERIVARLVRLADEVPENVLFQYLFHLHMSERRPLLTEFLDSASIPHEDGVLDLPEDFEGPEAEQVGRAANKLIDAHGRHAVVYLATLKVADGEFWEGLDPVLEAQEGPGE